MAKVYFNEKQKIAGKVRSLPRIIRSALAGASISQSKLGDLMGVSQQDISYKLSKKTDCWTYGELLMMIHETEMSDEDILKMMKIEV